MDPEKLNELAKETVRALGKWAWLDEHEEEMIDAVKPFLLRAFNTTRSFGDGT